MMNRKEIIFCSILRDSLSEEEFSAIGAMSSSDWSSIYEIARHNNLLALLYYKLKSHKISLPADWEETLRDSYLACSRKDIQRHKQLCELIKIFNDNRIDHILLKGSHLAEKIYIHSLLRPMCDIDILVKDEDIDRAYNLLLSKGYAEKYEEGDLKIVKDVFVNHYPALVRPNWLPVEIHRYLFENIELKNLPMIWARARETDIDGNLTKIMSIKDILLYMAIHGLKYNTSKLGIHFLYDLHVILSNCDIDWNLVVELLREDEWGNSKTLYSSLILAKEFFGTIIPEDFMERIKPSDFDCKVKDILTDLIICKDYTLNTEPYTFSYYLFYSLKKMSLKYIIKQSFFSKERIGSADKDKYKGFKMIMLQFRSLLNILFTFLELSISIYLLIIRKLKKHLEMVKRPVF